MAIVDPRRAAAAKARCKLSISDWDDTYKLKFFDSRAEAEEAYPEHSRWKREIGGIDARVYRFWMAKVKRRRIIVVVHRG